MTRVSRELVVFLASPSDLDEERRRVRDVAASVTHTLGARLGAAIRVTGWEQVQPDLGRPQEQINPYVDECDVFVGLVNRRMGSPTGASSSGFIEEFERAVQRRGDGNVPHLAIYFKDVPSNMLADPGQELSRVLKFKEDLDTQHRLLYQPFANADALAENLWSLFSLQLVDLASLTGEGATVGAAGTRPSPSAGALESEDKNDVDAAQEQIAGAAKQLQDTVRGVGSITEVDRDRLVLIALALAGDAGTVPVHVVNRLYRRREELALSTTEHRLWLYTLLADLGTSSREHRVVPGWGALLPEEDNEFAMAIVESVTEALDDLADAVVAGAFRVLQLYEVRPASLWLTADEASDDTQRPAVKWAKVIGRPGVAPSALDYLAALSTPADSDLVSEIAIVAGDSDSSDLAALLLGDARPAARAVASHFMSSDWKIAAVADVVEDLDDQTTEEVLVGRYTPSDVRNSAFEALQKRGRVSNAVLEQLLRRSDMQDAVFTAATDPDSPVSPETVATVVGELDDKTSDVYDLRDRALALTTPTETLVAQLDDPSAAVNSWAALGWIADPALVERAREVFDSDGSIILDGDPLRTDSRFHDFFLGRARIAALRILTSFDTVVDEDVDRVRREVDRGYSLTQLDARAIFNRAATSEDADALQAAAYKTLGEEKASLVQRLLKVGGSEMAHHLLESDDNGLRLAAVHHLGSQQTQGPDVFREHLYSSDPLVRMAALDALTERLSGDELETLLIDYPQGADDIYYYNVVCELDWLVYGPRGRPPDAVSSTSESRGSSSPPQPHSESPSPTT